MKLVYCATPARLGAKRTEILDFVTSKGLGPFHPFQAFEFERFEGGPVGREKTLEFCERAVDICDEFWLFGVSNGTMRELEHAIKAGKPLAKFVDQFDPDWKHYVARLERKPTHAVLAFLEN